ncbi:class I SAM-dependent methyltransferase [Coraliomargarita algicola]|uniref:Class I SAM-dependent methyltransferase n=1 Tax=Coraliomargarita algicola TaxID=3092156 RepID=A0ABZ0RFZ3_9BACT|nr:class I SAM-dependent methyltransferase [Coraliomargarita sp. J2-16]WPJ94991.1 class I SAM-dependent methyltransferase [Coraliomargarita sp. J2-16]
MNNPQVSSAHYAFKAYMTEWRWASVWRQIDLSLNYRPQNVMEVGSGPGVYKWVLAKEGIPVTTVDIAEDLHPDVVGSVLDLPFEDKCFDLSCAFQVLEHLPYASFIPAIKELRRVARKAVILSLPDAAAGYPTRLSIPGKGIFDFIIPRPYFKKAHSFDGQHYWEINKKETPLKKVLADIQSAGLNCCFCQRYAANMYHRFLVIE